MLHKSGNFLCISFHFTSLLPNVLGLYGNAFQGLLNVIYTGKNKVLVLRIKKIVLRKKILFCKTICEIKKVSLCHTEDKLSRQDVC